MYRAIGVALLALVIAGAAGTAGQQATPEPGQHATPEPFAGTPVAEADGVAVLYSYFAGGTEADPWTILLAEVRNATAAPVAVSGLSATLLNDREQVVDVVLANPYFPVINPGETMPMVGYWDHTEDGPQLGEWTHETLELEFTDVESVEQLDLTLRDVTEVKRDAEALIVDGWVVNNSDQATPRPPVVVAFVYDADGRFAGGAYAIGFDSPLMPGQAMRFTIDTTGLPELVALQQTEDPGTYTYRLVAG